jgi:hypothetical protein
MSLAATCGGRKDSLSLSLVNNLGGYYKNVCEESIKSHWQLSVILNRRQKI